MEIKQYLLVFDGLACKPHFLLEFRSIKNGHLYRRRYGCIKAATGKGAFFLAGTLEHADDVSIPRAFNHPIWGNPRRLPEDTETFAITLQNRERLCAGLRKMEVFFRKKTTAGYIAMQRRVLSLISNSSKGRYTELMQQYPHFQRIPKTMIAAYLGITRETLSRLDR